MNAGSLIVRVAALLVLPLATLVVSGSFALLAAETRVAWPLVPAAFTLAAFVVVAVASSRWTGGRAAAALVTVASGATTLSGCTSWCSGFWLRPGADR